MDTTPEPASYGHAEALATVARETIAAMTPADHLIALGDTPDMVAATLAALGITGVPMDPGACPIARYLRGIAGLRGSMVSVGAISQNGHFVATTPGPVDDFIRRFDMGMYPDLTAPAGAAGTGH